MRPILATAALSLLCLPAFAGDPIDMTAPLSDWDGKPMKDALQATIEDQTCTKCDDLTLGMAVTHAMLMVLRDDTGIDGAQRWQWQEIVRRVHKDKAAQLTAKEQAVIGDRLLKVYANLPNGAVVIGAAMPLIDPNRKPPELK